jgi:hypothetical protein
LLRSRKTDGIEKTEKRRGEKREEGEEEEGHGSFSLYPLSDRNYHFE